jgi:hypothetical protein
MAEPQEACSFCALDRFGIIIVYRGSSSRSRSRRAAAPQHASCNEGREGKEGRKEREKEREREKGMVVLSRKRQQLLID